MAEEEEVVYQSKGNKKMEKLIDQFVSGDKNPFSIKAALYCETPLKPLERTKSNPPLLAFFMMI